MINSKHQYGQSIPSISKQTTILCFLTLMLASSQTQRAYAASCNGPLDIHSPIHSGTKVVGYKHGRKDCQVLIYADNDLVGFGEVPALGSGTIKLRRPLRRDEVITARQSQNGFPTWPQKAVRVEKIPDTRLDHGEGFYPPTIQTPIRECQLGFGVEDLIEGVRVEFERSGSVLESGAIWTPYRTAFLGVGSEFREFDEVAVQQGMEVPYPQPSLFSSNTETVEEAPDKLPSPIITEDVGGDNIPDVLIGTTELHICDLEVGARLHVYETDQQGNKERIGGGIATGKCNIQPDLPPLRAGYSYCAEQSCGQIQSPSSQCIPAVYTVESPVVREPICEEDIEIVAEKTSIGSIIYMQVNGTPNNEVSAPGAATNIPVSGGIPLEEDDLVRVGRHNESANPPELIWSAEAVVKASSACEAISQPPLPIPPITIGSSGGASKCENVGAPCSVHPDKCGGRGPNWMVPGRIQCKSGKERCVPRHGIDYCSRCGGACGKCITDPCTASSQCGPGTECKYQPGGNECLAACTRAQNACWTIDEVGKAKVTCIGP